MQAIFTQEELAYLQSKPWWVACNITPYVVRAAFYKQALLISVSNLKNLWVARIDKPSLLKQKQKFAKTLQVAGFKQLIGLFQQILCNPETKALYHFFIKQEDILSFKIEKEIQVYPFQWKFDLLSIDCDISQMICKDILNPAYRTLQAQQRRFQIMKKKMQILEKNLFKKMTEAQKNQYKSVIIEDEQDLKLLVSEPKQEEFICDLRMDSISKMLFSKALQSTTLNRKSALHQKMKDRTMKVQAKVSAYSQPNAEQILNELEMKKQEEKQKKNKKKKATDFL